MNDLEKYFQSNPGRLIHKWHHYFDAYDRHFLRFRNKEIVIVEIGVFHGGSLQMWKNYFGKNAKIYGIDINPKCKEFEEENISIHIGSQSDRNFLQKIITQIPPIDILIDDGGHTMRQQIITFEELYGHIKPNGVYLCEDCHTSYWSEYGGGHKRKGSFIEYTKNWIDDIHAWHSRQGSLSVNTITKTAKSVHFYDSIVVIEKGEVSPPLATKTGKESFEQLPSPQKKSFSGKLKTKLINGYNKIAYLLGWAAIEE